MNRRLSRNQSRQAAVSPLGADNEGPSPRPFAHGTTSLNIAKLDRVPLKFIRLKAVRERTGLSRSTIWRLERVGAFPKRHQISTNAVAWVEQDVVDWIRTKAGVR